MLKPRSRPKLVIVKHRDDTTTVVEDPVRCIQVIGDELVLQGRFRTHWFKCSNVKKLHITRWES